MRGALAAVAMLPLFMLGYAISRGPQSITGTAPTGPVASYNLPLTPEQVERRLTTLQQPLSRPATPPTVLVTRPGSIQLVALRYPSALPSLPVVTSVEVPSVELPSVELPELRLHLGTPALLHAPPADSLPSDLAALQQPSLQQPVVALVPIPRAADATQCTAQEPPAASAILNPSDFATSLVAAAKHQTAGVAVYQARYVRIAYPGGDVSPFYGVCSDVVIRAYRSLGIDLQFEVQRARIGRGDSSIDHRRTETLRVFLARFGETLPVTDFAEDYLPGDIVTYYRPQNRTSTSHIAIVSDVIAPSGRLMIIHNRGFGVQLEDGLFVDKMTGHYRYQGPPVSSPVSSAIAVAKTKPPTLARLAMRNPQSRPPGAILVTPTVATFAAPLGR